MESPNIAFNEIEQIELILSEANAHNIRWEIQSTADKFIKEDPSLSLLEATIMAYDEWIT
jgi:hypothetical protein